MSKGIGSLQRHILDRLQRAVDERGWPQYVSTYDLAQSLRRDGPPTRSERTSVRRAVRNLEDRGLIEVWDAAGGLEARRRLTPEERARENRRVRRALEREEWPEILGCWSALYGSGGDPLPKPDSRPGQRLIRAGLPAEMLDEDWWHRRQKESGESVLECFELSDVRAHLRFEARRLPEWEFYERGARPPLEKWWHSQAMIRARNRKSRAEVPSPTPPGTKPSRPVSNEREMEERIAALVARQGTAASVRRVTPEPHSEP
jgi:hypothetical protein